MRTDSLQMLVAVFGEEGAAKKALLDVQAAGRFGSTDLFDAAIVVRTPDGKIALEGAGHGGRTWGKRGAVAGGLVGLIFPPSLIGSAVLGGGLGALWGKLRDKGIKGGELKSVGATMEPGTSAIVAVASDRMLQQLVDELEGYEQIVRHALSADIAAVISEEHEPERAGSRSGS